MANCKENIIEWVRAEKRATLTITQGRYQSKIKKLEKTYPEECQIVANNKDGSIVAHVPVGWIKINPPRQLTEEQRKAAAKRLNSYK